MCELSNTIPTTSASKAGIKKFEFMVNTTAIYNGMAAIKIAAAGRGPDLARHK